MVELNSRVQCFELPFQDVSWFLSMQISSFLLAGISVSPSLLLFLSLGVVGTIMFFVASWKPSSAFLVFSTDYRDDSFIITSVTICLGDLDFPMWLILSVISGSWGGDDVWMHINWWLVSFRIEKNKGLERKWELNLKLFVKLFFLTWSDLYELVALVVEKCFVKNSPCGNMP